MLTSLFDPVAVHFRDLYTFSIWIKMHGRYHSCRVTNHTFLYKGRWLPHARFLSYTFPNHNVVTTGNAPEVYYLSTTTAVMKRSWNLKVPQTKLRDPCVAFNWNVNSWVLATESLGGFFERTTLDDCVSIDIAKKQDYILGGYIQEKKRHENNTDELELGRWMQWASL